MHVEHYFKFNLPNDSPLVINHCCDLTEEMIIMTRGKAGGFEHVAAHRGVVLSFAEHSQHMYVLLYEWHVNREQEHQNKKTSTSVLNSSITRLTAS